MDAVLLVESPILTEVAEEVGRNVMVLVALAPFTAPKTIGKLSLTSVYAVSTNSKTTGPETPLKLRSKSAAVIVGYELATEVPIVYPPFNGGPIIIKLLGVPGEVTRLLISVPEIPVDGLASKLPALSCAATKY